MVGSKIRLTLYSIDDNALGLAAGRRCELHMSGETGSTHTYYTGILNLGYDLFGFEVTLGHQFLAAVDALFPLISYHIDEDGRLAVAAGIDDRVNLGNLARYRGEDGSRHKTACIGNLGTHLHHVALGNTGYGGSADML